jgi:hypothetical protein
MYYENAIKNYFKNKKIMRTVIVHDINVPLKEHITILDDLYDENQEILEFLSEDYQSENWRNV